MKNALILIAASILATSCRQPSDEEMMQMMVDDTEDTVVTQQFNIFEKSAADTIRYMIDYSSGIDRELIRQMASEYAQDHNLPCVEVKEKKESNFYIK